MLRIFRKLFFHVIVSLHAGNINKNFGYISLCGKGHLYIMMTSAYSKALHLNNLEYLNSFTDENLLSLLFPV